MRYFIQTNTCFLLLKNNKQTIFQNIINIRQRQIYILINRTQTTKHWEAKTEKDGQKEHLLKWRGKTIYIEWNNISYYTVVTQKL